MNSSLGLITELFHGISTPGGVAAPKPYFPKPSSFNNPSFLFQLFSQKPYLSFSTPTASRLKSIGKTVSCSNREEDVGGFMYKGAGVDIDAGSELVRRIAKTTPGIRGFGGLIPLGDDYLVHRTDGVGTKLMLAIETGIYEAIGIDLVVMCVNDIVTYGAKPLSFQDQYSIGHLDVDLAEKVILRESDMWRHGNPLESDTWHIFKLIAMPHSGIALLI